MIKKVQSLISVDPGSVQAGIAYFQDEKLINSEQLKLAGKAFYSRLRSLKSNVERFFSKYSNTEYISIETPFIGRNPQSGLKLGQARGVILALAFDYDVKIIDISPQEVRKYYGVKNNSKKEEYQKIVELEIAREFSELKGIDEKDAIAIGTTAIGKIKQTRLYNKAIL